MSNNTITTSSFVSTKLPKSVRNSGDAVDIFLSQCDPTQATLDVYDVLVNTAVDFGSKTFEATLDGIAEAAGVHKRTARRAVRALEDAGMISSEETTRDEGGRGPNFWTINKITSTHINNFTNYTQSN